MMTMSMMRDIWYREHPEDIEDDEYEEVEEVKLLEDTIDGVMVDGEPVKCTLE